MMQPISDRLPLVIGVTGHRDLRDEDIPRLEQEVAGIIDRLRRDYLGGDKETPIIVLSALAEGADRLFARVALRQGAQLIAPLPLPLEEYRRDFEPGLKPGNLAEFDELLARAIAAPVMPLGGSLELLRADGEKRAEQYRAVGIFIIRHCHVLLALWDGDDKDMAAGGTAEVVSFKRAGIPLMVSGSPRASLDASEVGPVIEVITPRMKATSAAEHIAVRRWGREVVERHRGGIIRRAWRRVADFVDHVFHRERDDERGKLPAAERRELESWENFEALIALTTQFNREASALANGADGPARISASIDDAFADGAEPRRDADARQHAQKLAPLWCALYGISDTLAKSAQAKFVTDWKLLFSFGYVAFFFFAIFAHVGIVSNVVLASYSLSFVAIFIVFFRAQFGRHQARYLDYRALAEALRVALYWKLLGIGYRYLDARTEAAVHHPTVKTDPLVAIADAYPIKQPSELAWVKICLRTLERLDKSEDFAADGAIDPLSHAIARRFWVRGQQSYFDRQRLRENRFAESVEAYAAILLTVPPFLLVPMLIFGLVPHWGGFDIPHYVVIVIGLLPGIAAALAGYCERLAFKAKARHYDRMHMLFGRAYDLLPDTIDATTAPSAQALYSELGAEAMKENAEWVAIYRQRPIQPVQ